jgi:PAS domain S-box-containing protein/putative nucleotidyltransferase with HDIG domain
LAPPLDKEADEMAKASIMVVEDESIISMEIQDRLGSMGYRICATSSTGEGAVKKAAETHPDLVLMDIMLKNGMDGIEATKEIRSRYNIPVVYLTAYADERTLERARATEPYGYLIKPFEDRVLYATIEMALYKHMMEKKVKESEQRYSTTLKCIADGVIVTDKAGMITYINPIAEGMTGWTQKEAVGKHLSEIYCIVTEDSRSPIEDPLARSIREKRIINLEHPGLLINREQNEIPIDDGTAPILDEMGRAVGAVLAFRDISERRQAEVALKASHEILERRVAEQTADLLKTNEELQVEIAQREKASEELERSLVKVEKTMEATIRAISMAVEARDRYTAGHQRRVTQLASAIARQMGLSPAQIGPLRVAGLLHDLGKIYIPTEILSKPGRLTDIEFSMIKTHTVAGYDIVKAIDFPGPTAEIVLQHHERLDGSGYPAGINAEEILLEARILAVSDVVEAMASHRPYRPALGIDKALEEISEKSGLLYDSKVVEACLELFRSGSFAFEE